MEATPLSQRVRESRRGLKWSQTELADRVSVSQSAISLFEQGRADVLSSDRVAAICRELGIEAPVADAMPSRPRTLSLKYCPDPNCGSNVAYPLGSARTGYWPRMVRADAHVRTFCGACGEVLLDRCPECRAACSESAFCLECGAPRISGPNLRLEEILHRQESADRLRELVATQTYRHQRQPAARPPDSPPTPREAPHTEVKTR